MVTKKKAVKKKAVTNAAAAPKATLSNKKLHVVLGDGMTAYERKCNKLKLSKSEVGRILIEAFVRGAIKVTPASAEQTKAIKA